MSSVLPDGAPPTYEQRHHGYQHGSATAGRPPPPSFRGGGRGGRLRRAPLDRGVKRTTECPCAVRLYHLPSTDVAARSDYCSVVLGAPSVGISEAGAGSEPSTSASSSSSPSSSAVARPVAVQLAWGDTTVWEVAHTALRALQSAVDAAYTAERRRLARTRIHNSSSSGINTSTETTAEEDHPITTTAEEAAEEEDEEAEAPYSSPPHRYEVELLTGSVNALGQASIIPLCTVACRQVLPGQPGLLPIHWNDSVDYNTALYELAYNLGDPVFVTCTRKL